MNFDHLYNLLLEANVDKRIQFLYDKYKTKLKFTEKEAFDVISRIVNDFDPTHGLYSEWIVKNFIKLDIRVQQRLLDEDYARVNNDLKTYHKFKRFFHELAKQQDTPELAKEISKLTDINQIQNFDDLYYKLRMIDGYIGEEEERINYKIAEKQVNKIYDSDNYLIVVPLSEAASCAYGRQTRWCTASTDRNRFEYYNKQGPLYIIIDKQEDEKYQFHFPSEQFMNSDDSAIELFQFLNDHEEIRPILFDLFFQNDKSEIAILSDPDKAIEKILEMPLEQIKKESDYFVYTTYLIALKNRELANSIQDLFVFNENDVHFNSRSDDFNKLYHFIGSTYRKDNEEFAKKILNYEYNPSIYDYIQEYDDSYWSWLNNDSLQEVFKYIKKLYKKDVDSLREAEEIIDENDDEDIKDALCRAYSSAYNSEVENKLYKDAVESIEKSLGSKHYFKDSGNELTHNPLCFIWTYEKLKKIMEDVREGSIKIIESQSGEILPATKVLYSFLNWYRDYLYSEELLDVPDFEHDVYISSSNTDFKNNFNERFSDEIYTLIRDVDTDDNQSEFDLSSVNRSMTQFDEYINKIFTEGLGNMGTGGMSNQSGSSAPNTNNSSFKKSTPSSNNNSNDGIDIDSMLNDDNTQWDQLLKNDKTGAIRNGLSSHLLNSMADPAYQNKPQLMNRIGKNPFLQDFVRSIGQPNVNPPIR